MTRRVIAVLAVGAMVASALVFVGVRQLLLAGSFCPLRYDTEKPPWLSGFDGRTAAYVGPGPRSLVSYEADNLTPVIFKMVASKPSDRGLPASWDARYEDGKPVDVQLVMCAYDKQYAADADEVSEVAGHCEGYRHTDTSGYRGASVSVPVRAAPVTYLLYEAATKRLLTKFTLTAKDFTQADCPYFASMDDPVVWISPKPPAVEAALKPFVEASR